MTRAAKKNKPRTWKRYAALFDDGDLSVINRDDYTLGEAKKRVAYYWPTAKLVRVTITEAPKKRKP